MFFYIRTQVHRYTGHIHFSQLYNYSTFFSTCHGYTGTQVHRYTGHILFSQHYNYSTFFSSCPRYTGTQVYSSQQSLIYVFLHYNTGTRYLVVYEGTQCIPCVPYTLEGGMSTNKKPHGGWRYVVVEEGTHCIPCVPYTKGKVAQQEFKWTIYLRRRKSKMSTSKKPPGGWRYGVVEEGTHCIPCVPYTKEKVAQKEFKWKKSSRYTVHMVYAVYLHRLQHTLS